jgi:hypothetical protein
MPHLIEPPTEPVDLHAYRAGLEGAHDALVVAAKKWSLSEIPLRSWGASAKRAVVEVGGIHPWLGVQTQPFNEIVNQSATVERLLDALEWAESAGFSCVLACHPTTSSGDHDLVVQRPDDGLGVFEVSDVAGPRGNENNKMANDLQNLVGCNCQYCQSGAVKYLATSQVSGKWLLRLENHDDRLRALGVARLLSETSRESETAITRVTLMRSA